MDDQVLTHWKAYLLTEKCVAKNTFQAYCSDIDQFVLFLKEKDKSLLDAHLKDLKSFIRTLQAEDIDTRSINRKIAALRSLFKYLHIRYNMQNHAQDLINPKTESKLPQYLSEAEIVALLDESIYQKTKLGERNRLIIHLLYATGMRISELAQLKVSNVQENGALLVVWGKGNKERGIPLPEDTQDILKTYLTITYPQITKGKTVSTQDPLFPVVYGSVTKCISRQSLWIILQAICKKAGIKKHISPHQLRHSLATHLLKNGADLRSLQLLLGHEKITTVALYTHVETTHLREVYDKKHPRS